MRIAQLTDNIKKLKGDLVTANATITQKVTESSAKDAVIENLKQQIKLLTLKKETTDQSTQTYSTFKDIELLELKIKNMSAKLLGHIYLKKISDKERKKLMIRLSGLDNTVAKLKE